MFRFYLSDDTKIILKSHFWLGDVNILPYIGSNFLHSWDIKLYDKMFISLKSTQYSKTYM